jgi:hypothetical protein
MAKITDDLITQIKEEKIVREREQAQKNHDMEVALMEQQAARRRIEESWEKARDVITESMEANNRKLADVDIELVFAQMDGPTRQGELKHWLLYFSANSQNMKHRVQVKFTPFLSGDLQADFAIPNDSTAFESRSYQYQGFSKEQTELIINRMIERSIT